MYYRIIRIHAPFSNEDKIIELCNQKNNLYYVYGMEISKKSKREHFHIVLKTERHPDVITKDIKRIFEYTDTNLWSNKEPKKTIEKCLAYAMKDGDYFVHWDNSDQIDAALHVIQEFQEESKFKTLRDKILYHINKLPSNDNFINTDLMFNILKVFKEKELAYPSQAWIKQCMVTYYMQEPTKDMNLKNIQTLYNIRDPFLDQNKNI